MESSNKPERRFECNVNDCTYSGRSLETYIDTRNAICTFYARSVMEIMIVIMNAIFALTNDKLEDPWISTFRQNHILSANFGGASFYMALFRSLISTSKITTLMNAKNVREYFKAVRLSFKTIAPNTSSEHQELDLPLRKTQ